MMDRYKPIKMFICLILSIHLSSNILYYLFSGQKHDGDKEMRRVFHNETSNITYIDMDMDIVERLILSKTMRTANSVPKIIHQSWNNYDIPSMTEKWIKRWKETNPDWDYVFWTDRSSRNFIAKFFPDYLVLYDEFELPVQKADLFRYFVLYAIGGVYADLDVEPLRSLNEITKDATCILSQEPEEHHRLLHKEFSTKENNFTLSCNAFMMCRSRHPYMAYLINAIVERRKVHKKCILPETLFCTGPYIVSTAYVQYKAIFENSPRKDPADDVICPAPDYFLPTWDPLRTGWLRIICLVKKRYDILEEKDKRICDRLKAKNFKNAPQSWSYTNHHWFHSWTEERTRYLSRRYDRKHIFQIVPGVIYGSDFVRENNL